MEFLRVLDEINNYEEWDVGEARGAFLTDLEDAVKPENCLDKKGDFDEDLFDKEFNRALKEVVDNSTKEFSYCLCIISSTLTQEFTKGLTSIHEVAAEALMNWEEWDDYKDYVRDAYFSKTTN